jgi:hypothetical protein
MAAGLAASVVAATPIKRMGHAGAAPVLSPIIIIVTAQLFAGGLSKN